MISIVGDRGNGKTEALVKLSAATDIPIFAHNRRASQNIKHVAASLGVDIPEPVSSRERVSSGERKIMIDEAQRILKDYFGVDVVCVTFDAASVDMSSITLIELLGMWYRMRRNGTD